MYLFLLLFLPQHAIITLLAFYNAIGGYYMKSSRLKVCIILIILSCIGTCLCISYSENQMKKATPPHPSASTYDTNASSSPIPSANVSESATSTPSPISEDTITVYRTKYGKCYHLPECSYLKSCIKISLREAKARGLSPCQKCNPPE